MVILRQGAREKPTDPPQAKLTVSVPASAEAGFALRCAVRALERWLGAATIDDLELIVTELASNGVKHGRPGEPGNRITLDACVRPERLRVAVRDGGGGFTPPRRSSDHMEPGGWGLLLVDDIAERWGVEREPSTTVWFELPRAA